MATRVLPPVPKVVKVAMLHTYQVDPNVIVHLYLQYSGTLSQADLITWLTNINTAWAANIMPLLSSAVVAVGCQGTDLSSVSSPQALVTASNAGSKTTQPMAAGVAAVIRFKINRRYRGGHPRVYIPGMVSTDMTSTEVWTSAFTTALGTGFNTFINAISVAQPAAIGTITHVNISYFQGFTNVTFPSGRVRPVPNIRTTPLVDPIIFGSYSVNPLCASQRRRNKQSV